jgi:UDP-glucose 4-epimerase
MNSRALLEAAVNSGVRRFIFSSTAAVYGNPVQVPVDEDALPAPMSPYGNSKLMTEVMLKDVGAAYDLGYVILRYFNVAGADPAVRTGQSTVGATHLIKVAVEAALGLRPKLDVYGTYYDTPDGTCIRDYIPRATLRTRTWRAHASARWRQRDVQLRYGTAIRCWRWSKRSNGRAVATRSLTATAGDPATIVADSDARGQTPPIRSSRYHRRARPGLGTPSREPPGRARYRGPTPLKIREISEPDTLSA